MKLEFKSNTHFNLRQLIRRCGYGEIVNRQGEVSYVRVFGVTGYPRFHAYLETQPDGFQIKLHLDQKKPSYGWHTAHSGEYDGAVVEREAERINSVINGWLRRLVSD